MPMALHIQVTTAVRAARAQCVSYMFRIANTPSSEGPGTENRDAAGGSMKDCLLPSEKCGVTPDRHVLVMSW